MEVDADPLIAGKIFALICILCVIYMRENGHNEESVRSRYYFKAYQFIAFKHDEEF